MELESINHVNRTAVTPCDMKGRSEQASAQGLPQS